MRIDKRIAVLIDSDNISAKYIHYILTELSNNGTPTIKRAYGDWTKPNLNPWKRVLLNRSIQPIQQFSYTTGKNATDSALIIDAMDILHSGKVDSFCIVSSDSDFTRLAARIREAGLEVIGIGERKTPDPFINACDVFKYVDVLENTHKEEVKPEKEEVAQKDIKKSRMISKKALIKAIAKIIEENSDEDEWIGLGELGSRLQKRHADFDSRNYGYAKLSSLIKSFGTFEVEIRRHSNNPHSGDVYVRNKGTEA